MSLVLLPVSVAVIASDAATLAVTWGAQSLSAATQVSVQVFALPICVLPE